MAKWQLILQTEDGQGYPLSRNEDYNSEPSESELQEMVVKLLRSVKEGLADRYWSS